MGAVLCKMGNLFGIVAPVAWTSAIIFCGLLRPEFSHYTQYISELGERASSTEFIMRYAGFVPAGLMHMAFAAFLLEAFKGRPWTACAALLIGINGLARIGAGIFPCEPGCAPQGYSLNQQWHGYAASLGFFAFIGAALLWGVLLRRYPSLRCLSVYSVVSAGLGLIFLALMSWSDATRAGTGLYERLSSGVLSLWLGAFAIRLWWIKAHRIAPDLAR